MKEQHIEFVLNDALCGCLVSCCFGMHVEQVESKHKRLSCSLFVSFWLCVGSRKQVLLFVTVGLSCTYLLTYLPHFSALAHRMLVKYLECAHPLSFPLFSPPHPCVFLLSPLFFVISLIFPCCAGPTSYLSHSTQHTCSSVLLQHRRSPALGVCSWSSWKPGQVCCAVCCVFCVFCVLSISCDMLYPDWPCCTLCVCVLGVCCVLTGLPVALLAHTRSLCTHTWLLWFAQM